LSKHNQSQHNIKVTSMVHKSANVVDLILFNSERKSYGIKNAQEVFGDCKEDFSLQFWELTCNQSLYLSAERIKVTGAERQERNKVKN